MATVATWSRKELVGSDIGMVVRDLRRKRAISPRVLAELAGVTHNTVYDLENGRNVMVSSLVAILAALNYDLTVQKKANT